MMSLGKSKTDYEDEVWGPIWFSTEVRFTTTLQTQLGMIKQLLDVKWWRGGGGGAWRVGAMEWRVKGKIGCQKSKNLKCKRLLQKQKESDHAWYPVPDTVYTIARYRTHVSQASVLWSRNYFFRLRQAPTPGPWSRESEFDITKRIKIVTIYKTFFSDHGFLL